MRRGFRVIFIIFFVVCTISSAMIVSAEEQRGEWSRINYEKTAFVDQDWTVFIKMTNHSVMLGGYKVVIDGVTVVNEFFQDRPAVGSLTIFLHFVRTPDEENSNVTRGSADGIEVPLGDHEVTLILLPMERSTKPTQFQDIYDIELAVERTFDGFELTGIFLLFLIPVFSIIGYGVLVYFYNRKLIHNVNPLNFPLVLYKSMKSRGWVPPEQKDVEILHRREKELEKRALQYIRKKTSNIIPVIRYMFFISLSLGIIGLMIYLPLNNPEHPIFGYHIPVTVFGITFRIYHMMVTSLFFLPLVVYFIFMMLNLDRYRINNYTIDPDEREEYIAFCTKKLNNRFEISTEDRKIFESFSDEYDNILSIRKELERKEKEIREEREELTDELRSLEPLFITHEEELMIETPINGDEDDTDKDSEEKMKDIQDGMEVNI